MTDELIAERRSTGPGHTPEDMPPAMRRIVSVIDIMNLWVGRVTCVLLIPVMASMVYEVVARKLFLAPTVWAYDVSRMAAGAMFMAGAGYALMQGVHIRADFLYRAWSRKTQATVDALLYLAFYFPAVLFFFWISLDYTITAWVRWERTMDTTLMAPVAPARTAMPVGAFFLLLQGVAEVLRSIHDCGRERGRSFLRFLPIYVVGLAIVFVSAFFPDVLPFGGWWSALLNHQVPMQFRLR